MILVDTSVWIDHLQKGVPALAAALQAGRVLIHSFVIGELACGMIQNRQEVLDLLGMLPAAPTVTEPEALGFIEQRALMGRGLGYIDVHLLASTVLVGTALLWTRDKSLRTVARELGLGFQEGT